MNTLIFLVGSIVTALVAVFFVSSLMSMRADKVARDTK